MKDLSLHILDIAQNAIRANAKRIDIEVQESIKNNTLNIVIRDNGCGMSQALMEKVLDPFYTTRTTRKVGLGIPLFKQSAEMSAGKLQIKSKEGEGTELSAHFTFDHLDRPSLGDIAGVICLLIQSNESIQFCYTHQTDQGNYHLNTKEIQETLSDSSLNDPKIIKLIKEMIIENLKEIKISKYYS